MSKNNKLTVELLCSIIIYIILLSFKLFNVIHISWIWVFSPIWIPLLLVIIVIVINILYNYIK